MKDSENGALERLPEAPIKSGQMRSAPPIRLEAEARLLIIKTSGLLLALLIIGFFAVILIRPIEAHEMKIWVSGLALPLLGCLVGNRRLAKLFKALAKVCDD